MPSYTVETVGGNELRGEIRGTLLDVAANLRDHGFVEMRITFAAGPWRLGNAVIMKDGVAAINELANP